MIINKMKLKKLYNYFFITSLPWLLFSCSIDNGSNSVLCQYKQVDFSFNQETLHTEVACTNKEREIGLMNRSSLPSDHGMIFLFNQEKTQAFWMKDTLIPLSIAFVDRHWNIVDIQEMNANDETPVYSKQPAMYVIEANKNWFFNHQIKVGTKIYLSVNNMLKK